MPKNICKNGLKTLWRNAERKSVQTDWNCSRPRARSNNYQRVENPAFVNKVLLSGAAILVPIAQSN